MVWERQRNWVSDNGIFGGLREKGWAGGGEDFFIFCFVLFCELHKENNMNFYFSKYLNYFLCEWYEKKLCLEIKTAQKIR